MLMICSIVMNHPVTVNRNSTLTHIGFKRPRSPTEKRLLLKSNDDTTLNTTNAEQNTNQQESQITVLDQPVISRNDEMGQSSENLLINDLYDDIPNVIHQMWLDVNVAGTLMPEQCD